MRFTIVGIPRTKKNSGRRIKRGNRVYSVPSEAAVFWEALAISQLMEQRRAQGPIGMRCLGPHVGFPLRDDVHVCALIYRDADRGDLVGFLQAIGDALQGGHGKSKIPCVLTDDEQIASWDGSRLFVDKDNPRVEIEITPMETP
jgi:Holliday junction resolvase RusA-like endonuclease